MAPEKEKIVQASKGEVILYRNHLEVRLEKDTVWLTQKQMSELFQKDVRTINEHIGNIFIEGELLSKSVIRNFRITASDGKKYDTTHYTKDGHKRIDDNALVALTLMIAASKPSEKDVMIKVILNLVGK